jgi:hypothetical protein
MSVLIETSVGTLVVDLFTEQCPTTSLNFLKLCKLKYYNGCLFFDVQVHTLHMCIRIFKDTPSLSSLRKSPFPLSLALTYHYSISTFIFKE